MRERDVCESNGTEELFTEVDTVKITPYQRFHFHGFKSSNSPSLLVPPRSPGLCSQPGRAGYCKFLRILRNPGNLHAMRCVPGVFPLQCLALIS